MRKLIEYLMLVVILCGFLSSIGIFVWQLFHWMRTDQWVSLPLAVLFGGDLTFIYSPIEWKGLVHILRWILEHFPLSICIPFILGIPSMLILTILDDLKKP